MTLKDGKPCKRCGSSDWYSDGKCKKCKREAVRQWAKNNPERKAEYKRRWAKENPKKKDQWAKNNPEKNAEKTRRWRMRNPEQDAAISRRWKTNNPERAAATKRQWQMDNRDKRAAVASRRRTQKTKAGGSYTAAEWKSLVEHYAGKCLCCGRNDVKLTADHVIPVAKGGSSNIDNIQPLCQSCNSRKKDKAIDYRPGKGLGRWIQRKLFG